MTANPCANDGQIHVLDFLALFAISFALSLLCYHPFYFGDELTAFFFTGQGKTFTNIYDGLNHYKPRLLFNALWALYGLYDVPRYCPMLVNVACMGGAASMIYAIARKVFNSPRAIGLLIAIILITSRFGAMLYFDYVAGNIETLSLLLFLAALFLVLHLIQYSASSSPIYLMLAVVLLCLTVLVHERYIAAAVAIGGWLFIVALLEKKRRFLLIGGAMACAGLPLLVFILAGRAFSSMPITTGTAGRSIIVNADTMIVFVTYLSNVVLGTNIGHPWFVGTLNLDHAPGSYVIPVMAISLGCLWTLTLWKLRHKEIQWKQSVMLAGVVCALVAVASLPGPAKQSSRWMFPVGAVLCLLIASLGGRRTTNLLLVGLLVANIVYFATGSYKGIFNVQSSETARIFGDAFLKVSRAKDPAIILDAPEPQTGWWLGGDTILGNTASTGLVFCRINFGIDAACAYPPTAARIATTQFGFGLKFERGSNPSDPSFTYVDKAGLRALAAVNAAAAGSARARAGVSFVVSPAYVSSCGGEARPKNVNVRWEIAAPDVTSVVVWLVADDGSRHLFSKGGRSGSAETGSWVTSPVTFVLMSGKTKEILASASVRAKPCGGN